MGHPDGQRVGMALSAAAQHLVKQEAMKYLATMQPGTRVAILGMSNKLHLVQGFTSDPGLLPCWRWTRAVMEYNLDGRAVTYESKIALRLTSVTE